MPIYGGETKTYYRFNGHGDVIALANSSGAIIKRYKYDSFGVEENPGIFDTNVFRYCGEYYDIETKTIYLRARYYDAETGRFTQQDGWSYAVPGFLLSLNLYTYCGNDPVNHIDPSGHFLKKLGNKIKNTASAIGNSILQVASSAVKTVKRTVNNIVSNVKTLVNGVADGIGSAISWAKNDISTEELGTQLKETAAEVAETVSSNIVDEIASIIEYNTDILDATYTVIEELVPPVGELIDTLKDFHYNRNDNQPIEELPQTLSEAEMLEIQNGTWIEQEPEAALCHQHTAGANLM